MPPDATPVWALQESALIKERQALRMRRFGMAVLSAFVTYLMLTALYLQGLVDGTALSRSAIACSATLGLFYVVFRAGWNLRFRDPSLTAAQILSAEFIVFLMMYDSANARATMTAFLTVPLLFGVYRFSTRKLMKLALALLIIYAAVLLLLWRDGLHGAEMALEVGRLFVMSTVLILIAFVGGQISLLRRSLHDSKLFFQTIWDTCNDVVVVSDADGIVRYANPSLAPVFGITPTELVGRHVGTLQPEDVPESESLARTMEQAAAGKYVMETEAMHAGGRRFPVQATLGHASVNGRDMRVAFLADITERKINENQIRHLAHHDPLTGLPNRMTLQDRLQQAIANAARQGSALWVLFLDVDRFKLINDSLGHHCGDIVLTTIAARLMDCCRDTDTVARLGGDEFVVLLPEQPDAALSAAVIERIMDRLAQPMNVNGNALQLTPSIGIAVYPQDGETANSLVEHADAAMYRAKQAGRNNFCFYTASMNDAALARLHIENDLRNALAGGELLLHYQPQFDAATGTLAGAEALLRWQHPRDGLMPPAAFIPIAEETGLIVPIGEWVIRTACEQQHAWRRAGLPPLRVAVNLSQRQFSQTDLVETVARILKETGADGQLLEFEITESTLMRDVEYAVKQLRELRALGVRLSIDDFGIGYSSLAFLKHFPVEILKIDRSFVEDMQEDGDARAIVQAIVTLAQTLQLEVVAEGVEHCSQLEALKRMRCDRIQGFLLGRPIPAEEIEQGIRDGRFDGGGKTSHSVLAAV